MKLLKQNLANKPE